MQVATSSEVDEQTATTMCEVRTNTPVVRPLLCPPRGTSFHALTERAWWKWRISVWQTSEPASEQVQRSRPRPRSNSRKASVVMKRLSYPTETVLSNKITRNKFVLSFKDSPRKSLGRRPILPFEYLRGLWRRRMFPAFFQHFCRKLIQLPLSKAPSIDAKTFGWIKIQKVLNHNMRISQNASVWNSQTRFSDYWARVKCLWNMPLVNMRNTIYILSVSTHFL